MLVSRTTDVLCCWFFFFFSPFTSLVTSRPANTSNKVDLPAPKYMWYYDSDDDDDSDVDDHSIEVRNSCSSKLTTWLLWYRLMRDD